VGLHVVSFFPLHIPPFSQVASAKLWPDDAFGIFWAFDEAGITKSLPKGFLGFAPANYAVYFVQKLQAKPGSYKLMHRACVFLFTQAVGYRFAPLSGHFFEGSFPQHHAPKVDIFSGLCTLLRRAFILCARC
jgi:hypothetical protein